MLKRYLPLIISILFFSAAHAQPAKPKPTQITKAKQYYKSGIKLRDSSRFPEALAEFTKATQFNKKFDSAYVEIGNLYSKSGNTDLAISHYKKALAINAKYSDALFGMGKLYRDAAKKFDSAIYYFNAAAELTPPNKEVFYGLAWIYNAQKKYDLAIVNAVKALEVDNNYRPAYGELGHAFNASKKYTECVEQLKKNLAVSVVDVAYLYSGLAYIQLKNKEGAMQQYESLLKVNEKMATSLKKKIDAMTE